MGMWTWWVRMICCTSGSSCLVKWWLWDSGWDPQVEDATHVGRVPNFWFNERSPFEADLTCSGIYFYHGDYSVACSIFCESLCQRSYRLRVPVKHAKIQGKWIYHPHICANWVLLSSGHLGSLNQQPCDGRRWGMSRAESQQIQVGDTEGWTLG